jgi:NAD(P)-dependent dehydrogenase (short-subunit alcohol dehydrogenase family)
MMLCWEKSQEKTEMAEILAGKIALITGAGTGIGAATAHLFAKHGATVVLAGRTLATLEQTASTISTQSLVLSGDVADEPTVEEMFQRIQERFGTLDLLVNNAAIAEVSPLVTMEARIFDETMRINVRGPFLCSRAAFRLMIQGGKGGAIVNICSLAGIRGPEKFPGFSAYSASKYALLGLSDVLAVEGRPHGIRVNSVSPGATDTQMLRKAAPFLKTKTTPEDVAESILFLCDPKRASRISGANLEIFSNE